MRVLIAILTLMCTISCESVYEFKQDIFISDIVVTCILDANGTALLNVEQTYPVVGYSDVTESQIEDFEVTLYENGIIVEELEVSLGENYFKTNPKVGNEYNLSYQDKGKNVISDIVVIPEPLRSVTVSDKKITNSKVNSDTQAIEVAILAELDSDANNFVSFRILGKGPTSFQNPNSYDPQRDGLLEDPCNEIGIFDSYIVGRSCAINNKIIKYLGAELVYYGNGTFFYDEFKIVVETMSESYRSYLTDINIDSVERAFIPYFSAYSNMSNGIGVIAARNTSTLIINVP